MAIALSHHPLKSGNAKTAIVCRNSLQRDYHHTLAKMEIVWTLHAEERQRQWEQRLSITRQEVETVLRDPE